MAPGDNPRLKEKKDDKGTRHVPTLDHFVLLFLSSLFSMQGRSNSLYLVLRFLRAVLREVKGCFRWSTLSLVASALSLFQYLLHFVSDGLCSKIRATASSLGHSLLAFLVLVVLGLGLSPSPMLWVSEAV
ncbi:hypothetical protein CXB51_020281 [Gossypium anomalum]|uniref:Uncharacterized protein n=1 Tax=Gossypium anomalum TaxID=47600 RepID=A0A8J5YCS4_9ROSI|nr:hypothetical protein CXB51_020281 [Gossypium anomalum]